jgi:hypothetical protein
MAVKIYLFRSYADVELSWIYAGATAINTMGDEKRNPLGNKTLPSIICPGEKQVFSCNSRISSARGWAACSVVYIISIIFSRMIWGVFSPVLDLSCPSFFF